MDKKNQKPENGTHEHTGKGFKVIDADKGLFHCGTLSSKQNANGKFLMKLHPAWHC